MRSAAHVWTPSNNKEKQTRGHSWPRGRHGCIRNRWRDSRGGGSQRSPLWKTRQGPPTRDQPAEVLDEANSSMAKFNTCASRAHINPSSRNAGSSRQSGQKICRCPEWVTHTFLVGKSATESAGIPGRADRCQSDRYVEAHTELGMAEVPNVPKVQRGKRAADEVDPE